jgi:solute carrier family 35 protein E3
MWEHWPFVMNCGSAVSLVFLNKHLMKECSFHFLGLLAALHMGVTSVLAVQQTQLSGKMCQLQHSEVAFFLMVTVVSLVSMNLSLLVNHVGVYQISKIAMIPACCLLEYLTQGKRITLKAAAAMAVLIAGVLTACVARFVLACYAMCAL